MAVADFVESHRGEVKQALEFTRTTVVGGALFLLPIMVAGFVLGKVFGLMGRLTAPMVAAFGVESIGGVAVSQVLTVVLLVLAAFLAGLFARTGPGQSSLRWIQDGVSAALPQFSLIQDVAKKAGAQEDVPDLPVVLAPTDAGWQLGLLVESDGDWRAVYLPGAPQMSSGAVAYAHKDSLKHTDLTLKDLWMLMRGRGKGSAAVYGKLAALEAAGKL